MEQACVAHLSLLRVLQSPGVLDESIADNVLDGDCEPSQDFLRIFGLGHKENSQADDAGDVDRGCWHNGCYSLKAKGVLCYLFLTAHLVIAGEYIDQAADLADHLARDVSLVEDSHMQRTAGADHDKVELLTPSRAVLREHWRALLHSVLVLVRHQEAHIGIDVAPREINAADEVNREHALRRSPHSESELIDEYTS